MPNKWSRCPRCGSNRDYLKFTDKGVTCTLCGKTWSRFPTYDKLMELERQKAEVLTRAREEGGRRGIEYHRSRDER